MKQAIEHGSFTLTEHYGAPPARVWRAFSDPAEKRAWFTDAPGFATRDYRLDFRTGGTEAYEFGSSYYWSSSDYNPSFAWFQHWYSSLPGYQSYSGKPSTYCVRAVRRSVI